MTIVKLGSGWSVRPAIRRNLRIPVELDTVGARTAEHAQQLRLGEGNHEVRTIAQWAGWCWSLAVQPD